MTFFLQNMSDIENKKTIDFLSVNSALNTFFQKLSEKEKKIIVSLILIDQAENIFRNLIVNDENFSKVQNLINYLLDVDKFYSPLGGIVGYHKKFCSLLNKKEQTIKTQKTQEENFLKPYYIDISTRDVNVDEYIEMGLLSMPKMVEIYPLGGSGDRLNLLDESNNNKPLPQAKLVFLGKTLIENLILDLQARENLYFSIYKERIETPVVIMTSDAKDNDSYVKKIFEENNYFGRKKDNFAFIKQLSMPVIDEKGDWVLANPLQLSQKPGGHGMLWNMMYQNKIFEWLENKNREYAIIRQINNPVAAEDYNFLAFAGYGILKEKKMGFSSCPRIVSSAEGMDVLKEKRLDNGYEYKIGNIEYTDFKTHGIADEPESKGSEFSVFPSNTNSLFVNLSEVKKAAAIDPLPGIIINLKATSKNGSETNLLSGRLELLMQSIADNFGDYYENKINYEKQKDLSTFLVHNIRRKTIAAIKNPYIRSSRILETPLGAYYDKHQNYRDILENYCNFEIPKEKEIKDFALKGPSFFTYLSPLLGPIYSDIGQTIKNGKIEKSASLVLDGQNIELLDIHLDGALIIQQENPNLNDNSSCILKSVKVVNKGIDEEKENIFWKNEIHYTESLKIILHENAALLVEDVVFDHDQIIEVPSNTEMKMLMKNGEVFIQKSIRE